jgi:hypothetical protein
MYHKEDCVSDSSIVALVFLATGTCLMNCCLTTGPLPSKDKGSTHRHRKCRLTTKELLKAVFSLWYDPKLYREDNSEPWLVISQCAET